MFKECLLLSSLFALSLTKSCDRQCDNELEDIICDTKNQQHKNACEFQVARCKDPDLKFAHDGRCIIGPLPCDDLGTCFDFLYDPVCGTNGKTYRNDCYFDHAQCKDSTLKVDYRGTCGKCGHCDDASIIVGK